jgi:hypothetical protein
MTAGNLRGVLRNAFIRVTLGFYEADFVKTRVEIGFFFILSSFYPVIRPQLTV